MAGNLFGNAFRFVTFGESHGNSLGVVVDGCPPGIFLNEEIISKWTERRKPGQSEFTTPRKEPDKPKILSGTYKHHTLGTPIAVVVQNKDHRPQDYEPLDKKYRPSHAEYTYMKKYGIHDWRGGGRASGRETVGRVLAGAIAFQVLNTLCPSLKTSCYIKSVGNININTPPQLYDQDSIYSLDNPTHCPDKKVAKKIIEVILATLDEGDSLGSMVEFVVEGLPSGLGEPVFDKLTADISKAMFSIPAARGVEIGLGFNAALMKGSEHNDDFYTNKGKIRLKTNNAGGVLGGISSGEQLYGRVAFKPVSTIKQKRESVDVDGKPVEISGKEGRHDPTVGIRAVAVVECMLGNLLLDHIIRNYGSSCIKNEFARFNNV